MARERIVKYPPKQGNLKRSEVKRAVEKIVSARRRDGEMRQTCQWIKKGIVAQLS